MVNGFALLVFLGFAVGLLVLVRRTIFTQHRSDLRMLGAVADRQERSVAHKVLRVLRARNIVVLVALVVGGVLAWNLHEQFPSAAGLPLAVAPAGMWGLASAVLAWWPLPYEFADSGSVGSSVASADLTPRSTATFGPRWGIIVPTVLLAATTVGLLVAGILSGTDEKGRFRNLPYISANGAELDNNMVVTHIQLGHGSVGPFPGWYYGLPVLGLLLVGAGLSLWALYSNARRPRLRATKLLAFDDAVRTNVGFVISTGFSAMLCLQAAPLMLFAASALFSSGQSTAYEVGQVAEAATIPDTVLDPVLGTLAVVIAVVALMLLVIGTILLVRWLGWMTTTLRPLKEHSTTTVNA